MSKKLLLFTLCIFLSLPLAGCSPDKQIEKAAVAETVTVQKTDGGTSYTFYILSAENADTSVTIKADSFEEAKSLAKDGYIPNLSLSRLELLIYDETLGKDFIRNDFEYISSDYRLSPLITVSLAEEKAFENFKEKPSFDETEQQIILLKNENDDVSYKLLSIYNKIKGNSAETVTLPCLTGDGGIKSSNVEISAKK